MFQVIKKRKDLIFLFLFILTLLPFINIGVQEEKKILFQPHELYNPDLQVIDNVNQIIEKIQSYQSSSRITDTLLFVKKTSEFVKNKFVHGLANYSLTENWIAYLLGKTVWSHFSAIVDPEDIIKHSEALCSQQTIVFMEILKRKHINFRTVGLGFKEGPGHFLCEVHYQSQWHLYDVTLEPQWKKVKNEHEELQYYLSNKDSLYQIYSHKIKRNVFDKLLEQIKYGEPNEFPAKKMIIFHKLTKVIIIILPILFLGLFIKTVFFRYQEKKSVEEIQ